MIKKLLPALTMLLGVVVTADANAALTYRSITDEEMKAMVTRILAVGSADSEKEEMKGLLDMARRVRPIVELVEAKCPMPVKVANGTSVPMFNVEIKVTERKGTSGTRVQQVFHIPYIPPKSTISGAIQCAIPSTGYGYQAYGERDIYMSASPIAEASRLDEEGIRKILGTNVDVSIDPGGFTSSGGSALSRLAVLEAAIGRRDAGAPAYDPKRPSIVESILTQVAKQDEDLDFKFLAAGLLRNEAGAAALGKWLITSSSEQRTITPLLKDAQPPKVRAMLEELMKGPSGDSHEVTFVAAAVTRVCGPGQPETERTSMWLAALGKDVHSESVRGTVLDKCGAGKEQTRARLKAAKPEQLGRALDGMQGELFDTAVAAMSESKSLGAASTLLASTQNDDKFLKVSKAALAFVTPVQREQLLKSVALAPAGGKLDDAKAAWLTAQLDELHARASDVPVLLEILAEMAQGRVASTFVRKAVYGRWKDAGKTALDPFLTAIAARPHVLAPAWIRAQAEAGKVDLVELLALVGGGKPSTTTTTKIEDEDEDSSTSTVTPKAASTPANTCRTESKAALACLGVVKSLPLTKDALDPKFVEAAIGFLRKSPHEDIAAKLATQLAELGVDMSPAVDALCEAAPKERRRWGYGSGHEDPLNTAKTLSASHPCIASVMAARASSERWNTAGIGLRLVLAFVPFGFVFLLAKRRLVPVRAQLAKENADLEQVRGKAAITLRLGAPKAEEALGAALSDAATFLEGDKNDEVAAAGRALKSLGSERRASLLKETRALAQRAAETGDAATMLAELDGLVLYLACFPGREDQPQAVRRHPGFTDGWPPHIERIVAACVADGRPSKVLSLVFMLGTDGAKTTLLVGYDTTALHFRPDPLAVAGEVTHDHRYELSLGEA